MKCIRCGHDSKFKERLANQCPSCKRQFAFEPQIGDPFTDQAFKNAIARVSSDGSVKFTMRNLYYEADRLKNKNPGSWAAAVTWLTIGSASIVAGIAAHGAWIVVGLILLVFAFVCIPKPDSKHVKLPYEEFEKAATRWNQVHGTPAGLFTPKMLPAGPADKKAQGKKAQGKQPLAADLQDELAHYSFDRAVITDTSATADVLLANDFHFENNCAVLSVDGHPAHAFATVRRMLRNNPKIEVFVLHDCTPEGCALAWQLRQDPAWFKDVGQVYDVALRPAQARKMKGSWLPGRIQVGEHPSLTEADRDFLRAHVVELAAIRPEQLVKRLFRAMTIMPAAAASGDGSTASDGSVVWSTDASTSDGGGDAFG